MANYGGYDSATPDIDLDKLCCSICTKLFRDLHLTGCCGQNFCESCLNYWFTKHRKENCPHCRAEGEEFQHLLDKKLKREIDPLQIHCTKKEGENGCQWVGEAGSLKNHLESDNGCGFVEVECCNKCKDPRTFVGVLKIKRNELENHMQNECPLRPYQCAYCGYEDTYQNITGVGLLPRKSWKRHYDVCLNYPLECPNKCGAKDVQRKDMENHRSQCPDEIVNCSNKCIEIFNVNFSRVKEVKRKDLVKHLNDECELRPYQCQHCGLLDNYKVVVTHYTQCPEFPLECFNKCGLKDIKRKDMKNHCRQCPEEPVRCPFEEAGCKEKLVRHELEQHMSTLQQVQQHLLMVMGAYKEVKQELAETKKKPSNLSARVSQSRFGRYH